MSANKFDGMMNILANAMSDAIINNVAITTFPAVDL